LGAGAEGGKKQEEQKGKKAHVAASVKLRKCFGWGCACAGTACRSTESSKKIFHPMQSGGQTSRVGGSSFKTSNHLFIPMKKTLFSLAAAVLLSAAATSTVSAQATMTPGTVLVGGMAMYPNKDIVSNAVNSKDHTTLVAAVKAAGLVETLQGKGPFTVFAPVNDAFENLPAGTVETLLKPENKATLTKVLTYHVVAGNMDAKAIMAAIKAGKGKATLKTVSGGTLTAMMNGSNNVVLTDESGNVSSISTYDVKQSNGVIHVIDKVLLPK
jgi:uncharacterized surface protein with fasciclin (FAS1) repeats